MASDLTKFVRLSAIDSLAAYASAAINDVADDVENSIKKVSVDGSTIKFFTDSDADTATAVAACTVNMPSEMVLDQTRTVFIPKFVFNSATYAGASNPNMDGKPVLVLGVKTTDSQGNIVINYSFLNLYDLVDIYGVKSGDSQKLLSLDGKEFIVNISASSGNIIGANNDGFFATTRITGASAGNNCRK